MRRNAKPLTGADQLHEVSIGPYGSTPQASRFAKGDCVHPESLLRIPLLAQMFEDPCFSVVRRGIDARWYYEELVSSRVEGFNPLRGCAFIGTNSHFDRWCPHRRGSARPFNQSDDLVSEALFVAHDYLHVWAYGWIEALCPELGFGVAPITSDNFEDMVFCHLLSEAVATVGLDYWYLSVVDLPEVVPIGTVQRGLTVNYRESWHEEYRRFNPELSVQHPSFLERLTRFYCDGVFVGFGIRDLRASPALEGWITHELRYGQLQRRYCRQWFSYLSHHEIVLNAAQMDAPLDVDGRWKKRLMSQLAERLWAKIKRNELCSPRARPGSRKSWHAPSRRAPDFRFINFNRCGRLSASEIAALPDDSFEYLLRQYAVRFDLGSFPDEAIGVFSLIREERDFSIGDRLLSGIRCLPPSPDEPRDLFLHN